MTELARTTSTVEQQLAGFESGLLSALAQLGLPTQGILVDFEQRHRAFRNFPDAVSLIDDAHRPRAMYLSKFLAAVGAGLFDAALNYLWDETISELRRRISAYDLAYFFDLAVKSPDRRKRLKDEVDLVHVDDFDLVRAAQEMGLVSEVGYRQLDLIRFMRNHASAAHPNQNDITALQLVGWVETCIKEVINLPESRAVAETKRLLSNVRGGQITSVNAPSTAAFLRDLPQPQTDNIARGLFGIYVDLTSTEPARDGVRLLVPQTWILLSEDQKQEIAAGYGRFVANADAEQARLAREFLDVASASSYLPEPVRVAELATAIDELRAAHHSFGNFQSEPGPARRLNQLAGQAVPQAVKAPYGAVVVDAFITNGNGVAWNADPHYKDMVGRFTPDEAKLALRQLFEPTVASRLCRDLTKARYLELLEYLDAKVTTPVVRELFDAVRVFTGPPSELSKDVNNKRLFARVFGSPP
jgi:hypothetical protein